MTNELKALTLRTGELNSRGVGKEMMRLFITRSPITGEAHINFNISFPIFNPHNNTISAKKNIWRSSETCIDATTATQLVEYLEKWPDQDAKFRTGLNYDRSISLTNDWLKHVNAPAKKIRIVSPGFGDKPAKNALTKISMEDSQKICAFIKNFIDSEHDTKIEDEDIEELNEINGNIDPDVEELRKKIRGFNAKIEDLSRSMSEAQEELDKILDEALGEPEYEEETEPIAF